MPSSREPPLHSTSSRQPAGPSGMLQLSPSFTRTEWQISFSALVGHDKSKRSLRVFSTTKSLLCPQRLVPSSSPEVTGRVRVILLSRVTPPPMALSTALLPPGPGSIAGDPSAPQWLWSLAGFQSSSPVGGARPAALPRVLSHGGIGCPPQPSKQDCL